MNPPMGGLEGGLMGEGGDGGIGGYGMMVLIYISTYMLHILVVNIFS